MREIKIDINTLPKDCQFVEFTAHGEEKYIGQFLSGDDLFFINEKKWFTAWVVHAWKPLEIEWEFDRWSEKKESLAVIKGVDNYNNIFEATGIMNGVDEILEIYDIELVRRFK